MLNWRRDPGYEQRMKQLENETEQLRQENRRLAALQSRMDALLRNE
jgi:cell shape-determining protein MreC